MEEQNQKRTRPTLVEGSIAVFAGFMLMVIITAFFMYLEGGKLQDQSRKLYVLLSEVFFFIPAFILVKGKGYNLLDSFRVKRMDRDILVAAVLIGVSLTVLVDEVERIMGTVMEIPEELLNAITELLTVKSGADVLVLGFVVVLLPAFLEEALFRGVLQKNLEEALEPANAIVITSVCFVALHHGLFSFVPIAIIAVILGILALRADNILPGVIVHGINNAISITMINLPDGTLDWYSQGQHVYPPLVAVAACIGYYAFRWFFRLTASAE